MSFGHLGYYQWAKNNAEIAEFQARERDAADAGVEARRMREINRRGAEQQLAIAKQQADLDMEAKRAEMADRRKADGSLKSDAEYAFDLKKREAEMNDAIAERGWRKRQDYAEGRRKQVEGEQRASASQLAEARMGRRRVRRASSVPRSPA